MKKPPCWAAFGSCIGLVAIFATAGEDLLMLGFLLPLLG